MCWRTQESTLTAGGTSPGLGLQVLTRSRACVHHNDAPARGIPGWGQELATGVNFSQRRDDGRVGGSPCQPASAAGGGAHNLRWSVPATSRKGPTVGSVIKKRRKRMAKKKHRKLLKKTRIQRRRAGK